MTRRRRLGRRLTSSARKRKRNRAARHAEWAAAADVPGPVTAGPSPLIIWGPAHFWLWPRPARPWVQSFPHRRGHSSRPGSSRRRRGR